MHLLLRDGEVIFLNFSNFPTREAILSICKSTLSVPVRIPFHLSACMQDWLSYSGCVAIGEVVVARGKCPLGTVRGGVSTLHAKMSWKLESNTPSSVDQKKVDGGQMPPATSNHISIETTNQGPSSRL